jgi:hypothetical protein
VLLPRQQAKLARGAKDKEHAMSQTPNTAIAVIDELFRVHRLHHGVERRKLIPALGATDPGILV